MINRMDLDNPEVIALINKKYEKLVPVASNRALMEIKRIRENYEFYKTHSLEQIIDKYKSEAKEKYLDISDYNALAAFAKRKIASEKGNSDISLALINKEIEKMSDSDKKRIATNYKKRSYELYVSKKVNEAKRDIAFYSGLSEEQFDDYSNLLHEKIFTDYLIKIREQAIVDSAIELGVDIPSCLDEKELLDKESEKILSIENQSEDDIKLKEKIKKKIKFVDDYLTEYAKPTYLSLATGAVTGAILGMLVGKETLDTTASISTYILSSPAIVSALIATHNLVDNTSYFHNRKNIEEAKKLGLLDLFVAKTKISKELKEFLEPGEGERSIGHGGKNGLY